MFTELRNEANQFKGLSQKHFFILEIRKFCAVTNNEVEAISISAIMPFLAHTSKFSDYINFSSGQ